MNKPELEPEIKLYRRSKRGMCSARLYRDKYVRVHTEVKIEYNPGTDHIYVGSYFRT